MNRPPPPTHVIEPAQLISGEGLYGALRPKYVITEPALEVLRAHVHHSVPADHPDHAAWNEVLAHLDALPTHTVGLLTRRPHDMPKTTPPVPQGESMVGRVPTKMVFLAAPWDMSSHEPHLRATTKPTTVPADPAAWGLQACAALLPHWAMIAHMSQECGIGRCHDLVPQHAQMMLDNLASGAWRVVGSDPLSSWVCARAYLLHDTVSGGFAGHDSYALSPSWVQACLYPTKQLAHAAHCSRGCRAPTRPHNPLHSVPVEITLLTAPPHPRHADLVQALAAHPTPDISDSLVHATAWVVYDLLEHRFHRATHQGDAATHTLCSATICPTRDQAGHMISALPGGADRFTALGVALSVQPTPIIGPPSPWLAQVNAVHMAQELGGIIATKDSRPSLRM